MVEQIKTTITKTVLGWGSTWSGRLGLFAMLVIAFGLVMVGYSIYCVLQGKFSDVGFVYSVMKVGGSIGGSGVAMLAVSGYFQWVRAAREGELEKERLELEAAAKRKR